MHPIPNQDKKYIGLNKYQRLTLDVHIFIPRNNILLKDENNDNLENYRYFTI